MQKYVKDFKDLGLVLPDIVLVFYFQFKNHAYKEFIKKTPGQPSLWVVNIGISVHIRKNMENNCRSPANEYLVKGET